MAHKRHKHEEHEEHENHERWLVTYADMLTLLFVLFVVMFAMSSVDAKKFEALKSGLAAGFGQTAAPMTGSRSILSQAGTSPMSPIAPQARFRKLDPEQEAAVQNAVQARDLMKLDRQRSEARAEVDRLDRVRSDLYAALKRHGLEDDVKATFDGRGLVLSLVSRHVVFEADLATLSPRGVEVVDTLGPLLADISDPLEIDGHTNQVKVQPKYFATDWDLSAARAVTVLRRLNEVLGVPSRRLSLAAFGHEKPLVDPSEPGSQEVNKRVDIVVLSGLSAEVRALLAEESAAKQAELEAARTPTEPTATEQGAGTEAASTKTTTDPDNETAAAPAVRRPDPTPTGGTP